jgi:hypothetical protein
MSRLTSSMKNTRPAQYRARASEARERAAGESDAEKRERLLADAALWERMADYEDNHPLP